MLASISWQQYFAAVAIISFTYYVYVILRYYQREISNRFAFKQTASAIVQSGTLLSDEVMGRAKQDQGVTIVDQQELQFAAPDSIEAADEEVAEQPVGESLTQSQKELLQEVDNLITAFNDAECKSEFISLLNILISSYQRYLPNINYTQITAHVLAAAPSRLRFDLAVDDLPQNWLK